MSGLRAIATDGYAKLSPPSSFGKPARLEWLAIRSLVIDPEYQREISRSGRNNVARIVEHFSWSMFAPVIVSSVGAARFAIVDGQHRTTAAAICGIEKVPCCIIEAKRGEQAAAFMAINGNITRMHTTSLFHASVAAGDPNAIKLAAICTKAGVKISRYPKQASSLAPNETIAVSCIERIVGRFGETVAILALRCCVAGDAAGSLRQQAILGVAEVLADHAEWRTDDARLLAIFAKLDIPIMLMDAFEGAAKRKGVSSTSLLQAALIEELQIQFGSSRAA